MTAHVADVYASLARAFRNAGIRWVVFGAQAAIFHGLRRFTADVDVTVELRDLRPEELVAALRHEKVVRRFAYDEEFVRATRMLPMRHSPTGMDVDVVFAGSGLELDVMARAVRRKTGRTSVPIARLEDLLVMKLLAARPKDRDDVERLLTIHPEVDARAVRALLRELEEALDQSDLLPTFEQALTAAKRARKRL